MRIVAEATAGAVVSYCGTNIGPRTWRRELVFHGTPRQSKPHPIGAGPISQSPETRCGCPISVHWEAVRTRWAKPLASEIYG